MKRLKLTQEVRVSAKCEGANVLREGAWDITLIALLQYALRFLAPVALSRKVSVSCVGLG